MAKGGKEEGEKEKAVERRGREEKEEGKRRKRESMGKLNTRTHFQINVLISNAGIPGTRQQSSTRICDCVV